MADPFLAEIRILPFNFAPKGWAWCDGQLMPLSQNTALFALLGTNYGGNGKSNFALPDLQDRAPMHPGTGSGLTERFLGESGGSSTVTLLETEMPSHTHAVRAFNDIGEDRLPGATACLARSTGGLLYGAAANLTGMAPTTVPLAGGSTPHTNMMPSLSYWFAIALQGVFPQRP